MSKKKLKEAIILSGGKGTRLKSVVSDIPKPMADIAGIPFLEYLLLQCLSHSLEHIILAVGYKHEVISNYFGDTFKGIKLTYSIEKEALGTGGAIAQAMECCNENDVLILNGDSITNANFNHLFGIYQNSRSEFAILIKEMKDFSRYGTVEVVEGRIIKFIEKQATQKGYINTGVYVLNKEKFLNLSLPKKFSMEESFMESKVQEWHFDSFVTEGHFIDIGIPEDYEKAQTILPQIYGR